MRIAVLTVPDADAEAAADRLWVAGARAVEERPGGSGVTELRTVLADDDDVSRRRLGQVPPSWDLRFVDEADEPETTWRDFAAPIDVGDGLIIRPAWIEGTTSPGVTEIVVEPGGAFGLGDHPTTRLSAAAVHRLTRPGCTVLDVGCGTGVLSVIAAKRRARRVVAIDIAEAAREATDANARRNGVESTVEASTAPIAEVAGEFDLVVANILAPTLVEIATDLRRVTAATGVLVFSGVLAHHHQHVIDALAPMTVAATHEMGEWAAVEMRHA